MEMLRTAAIAFGIGLAAASASAQLRGDVYATGLTNPVAFVQDPLDPSVQHVVQQAGRIRVVRNGVVQSADFLNVTPAITSGGERGLLGLAFAPDYATSGRLYVKFTDPNGDTVVARFKRSAADPLRADPASRFDLRWPTGERVVRQPFSNHNGGNLQFGPDGNLYIGMGDGGSGNDPNNNAQNPASLLGKMLRIDVGVPDSDPAGYRIPPDNPFNGAPGTLAEIWSFGLRNPWRYSFDDPSRGGTGALVIGDVGQGAWEEVDYEPAGRGGRNYGWRIREGAHNNVTTLPPAFLPLTDPIHEYSHSAGISITGGYVYRGSALPAFYRGRYFFADLNGRVWSLALTIDPATRDATASDVREHTAELGGSATLGQITTFGVDANGELYVANYSAGTIVRIGAVVAPAPAMNLDVPANGATLQQPFSIGGWALNRNAPSGSGIDTIHVWAFPANGGAATFVGSTIPNGARPDVASAFGAQFLPTGFGLAGRGLQAGRYYLAVYARVTQTGTFDISRVVDVTVQSAARVAVDIPAQNARVGSSFVLAGWALDTSAASGVGVDTIHVWAFPAGGGTPVFLGVPALRGSRPDVGAVFGSQFTPSGFNMAVSTLPAGTWDVVVYVHSSVSNAFQTWQIVRVSR
jgi:glucose/arabinose dehydrogenase